MCTTIGLRTTKHHLRVHEHPTELRPFAAVVTIREMMKVEDVNVRLYDDIQLC